MGPRPGDRKLPLKQSVPCDLKFVGMGDGAALLGAAQGWKGAAF